MDAETRRKERKMRPTSRIFLILCFTFQVSSFILFSSADPVWWQSRNVMETNMPVADFAPVVMGQLKWIATNACVELQANLPNGAGSNVQGLVQGFANSNNWVTVNVGQLKAVASPFYARLLAEGYTSSYPWTGAGATNDYALANLGQMKNLFGFELTADSDADGLRDWWETRWFGSITNQIGSGDFDGDGLSNSNEYSWATCPTNSDCDSDGITDGAEVSNRTDPKNSDTTAPVITIDWPVQNRAWKIVP